LPSCSHHSAVGGSVGENSWPQNRVESG
jgi:hypothetical protein